MNKFKGPLTIFDTDLDCILKLSQGIPGAVEALVAILISEEVEYRPNIHYLFCLDDMRIRGSAVWVAYKDFCKKDVVKFKDLIIKEDADMIAFIKKEGYHAQKDAYDN